MALAGNADPLAGQPDMDALSEFLLGNWVDLLERGMIKAPPKGSIVDNTAAIAICENPGVTARNKHFSDAVHYVRHEYDHGRIRLVFVTTDKQRADGFTKPLESAAFHKWRRHIISAHPPV